MPRHGMDYLRGVIVLANPYCDDAGRKFSGVEVVFPETTSFSSVHYLRKLPQSLFMPGN